MRCHICGEVLHNVRTQAQYFDEVLYAHFGIVPDPEIYKEVGHKRRKQ